MSQQDEFMQKLFGGEGGEADSRQKLAEAIQAYLGENFVAMLAPETQIGKGRYPPRPCPTVARYLPVTTARMTIAGTANRRSEK